MSQLIFCLSILTAIVSAFSSVLRVETGHQNIEIQGRDPYFGYFTRIRLHDVTCIQSIIVHCLKPLTGAEEIDLLFLECSSRAVWKVGHYTNTKEEFRLKEHMIAREMLISSRKPLTIIDVQVKSCSNSTTKRPLHCHSSPLHPSFGHSRRHGKTGPIRAVDDYRTRRKREISSAKADKYPENAEFVITRNKIVKSGESLTVEKGVRLRFAEGVGLVVYGTLIVNGTQSSPVIFEPQNEKNWRGVEIVDGSPSSSISYLNVIGSELGLTIKGATPTINDVIVNGSDVGFRIESNSSAARLVNSYAINNKGAGFHFVGKVDEHRLP